MNPILQNLLGQATSLTRSGDLQGAMSAIQSALGRLAHQPAAALTGSTPPLAREVPTPTPQVKPSSPSGDFLSGRYAGASGALDYKLFVPPGHEDGGQALPLVVMLHGCTQNPDDFAAGTRMNEAARSQGFFVLYPAQAQSANAQRCWNWFKHNHQQRGKGEPAVLAAMTREVMSRYRIDPDRVYVAGLSAGGAMAAILGECYPDLFAAVGVHSGLPLGAATDVSSAFAAMKGGPNGWSANTGLAGLPGLNEGRVPGTQARPPRPASGVPTIVFHGDQDATVHPVNGEQVIAACMAADAASIHEPRARGPNGRHYTRKLHQDAQGRVMAEHWLVHGAGHAWSGGHAAGSYTDAQGPDATQEMLRFFFEQRRRSARAPS